VICFQYITLLLRYPAPPFLHFVPPRLLNGEGPIISSRPRVPNLFRFRVHLVYNTILVGHSSVMGTV